MARPVQYNQDDVLQTSMHLFWSRGYAATSMSELIQKTGLKSGSIYAGFGSKQGLFEASIDYYATSSLKKVIECVNKGDDYLQNIRQTFASLIESSLNPNPDGSDYC